MEETILLGFIFLVSFWFRFRLKAGFFELVKITIGIVIFRVFVTCRFKMIPFLVFFIVLLVRLILPSLRIFSVCLLFFLFWLRFTSLIFLLLSIRSSPIEILLVRFALFVVTPEVVPVPFEVVLSAPLALVILWVESVVVVGRFLVAVIIAGLFLLLLLLLICPGRCTCAINGGVPFSFPQLVVNTSLRLVLQHVVGGADAFELLFIGFVTGCLIWVILLGKFVISFLYLSVLATRGHTE